MLISLGLADSLLRGQPSERNVVYDIFTPLDIIFEAVKPSPQGIVSQVELYFFGSPSTISEAS